MAGINDEKLRQMEDEMNRFEAEIALPVLPPPPPPHGGPRPVIGSNTFNQVQRRLEEQQGGPVPQEFQSGATAMGFPSVMPPMSGFATIPPPPPPPPLLIPHQVQRGATVRHPAVQGMGMSASTQMLATTVASGYMPTSHLSSAPQMSTTSPYIPSLSMEHMTTTMASQSSNEGQAVVSATPLLYNPKPLVVTTDPETLFTPENLMMASALLDSYDKKYSKKLRSNSGHEKNTDSSRAKDMADRVKATTVVSVGPNTMALNHVNLEDLSPGKKRKRKVIRMAGGQTWEDSSLGDWEDDDFRIFCGDLGNDVTDEILTRAFNKYPSFLKAKVVRDKRSNKTKGFGFVSFKDPQDFIKAMKEMNGRYVGSRPIKLRKSTWKSRNLESVRKKEKEKTALIGLLTGR